MSAFPQDRLERYGAFVLRITLGGILLAHGLLKVLVFTLPGTAEYFASLGLPGVLAYAVAAAEVGGGLLLLLGVASRWVALAVQPVLLGALWVHSGNGWLFSASGGGWEFPLVLVLLALSVSLLGNGAFVLRLPARLAWRRGKREVAPA
ncbi:DoxX family protein [Accumulibacter sp.]|uniref:DoxX family protein n=1 Tax=Accumulibacter sp. TaxID=2053492 RepID=UPI0025D1458C|nr:DoxX family protein [Accumulibacter sp.]MCM8595578.1 DoxX family protein [Accumulibacter sp.]MCM8625534.1 DoxX family protein [Accumulibacter sp.]MDS4049726.1 DoxX family protein [Accumulibacter sp.]